jgi:hypothetical protein
MADDLGQVLLDGLPDTLLDVQVLRAEELEQ